MESLGPPEFASWDFLEPIVSRAKKIGIFLLRAVGTAIMIEDRIIYGRRADAFLTIRSRRSYMATPRTVPSTHSLETEPTRTVASATPRSSRHLAGYDRARLDPGRGLGWRVLWYFTSQAIFEHGWLPFSGMKVLLLRCFGARIGCRAVVKPNVRIKFPWRLQMGDDCWLGQGGWVDNLATVQIGTNVCLSQEAYLCTGSHDHRSSEFDLITRPIHIGDGAWIGARAILLPGVTVGAEAVVAAGAVVSRDVEPATLVAGNPARPLEQDAAIPRQPR